MKKIILISFLILLFLISWISFPNIFETANPIITPSLIQADIKPVPISFKTAFCEKRDLRKSVTETGRIRYKHIYDVNLEAGGELFKSYIKNGDTVEKGTLLIELKNIELENSIKNAKEDFDKTKQASENFKEFTQKETKIDIDIQRQNLINKINTSLNDKENAQKSFQRGMIAKKELENVIKAYELASKEKELLEIKLKKIELNLIEEEKKIKLILEEKQKDLDKLIIQQNLLKVYSPVSGKIISLSEKLPSEYKTSNLVMFSKGEALLSIAELKGRCIDVSLFIDEISSIKIGDAVEVSFPKSSVPDMKAYVKDFNANNADRFFRFPVILELQDETYNLVPQTLVECRFSLGSKSNVLSVPVQYITYDKGDKYCKIIKENAITLKKIQTGIDDGMNVEILSGIDEGSEVLHFSAKEGKGLSD